MSIKNKVINETTGLSITRKQLITGLTNRDTETETHRETVLLKTKHVWLDKKKRYFINQIYSKYFHDAVPVTTFESIKQSTVNPAINQSINQNTQAFQKKRRRRKEENKSLKLAPKAAMGMNLSI